MSQSFKQLTQQSYKHTVYCFRLMYSKEEQFEIIHLLIPTSDEYIGVKAETDLFFTT